MEHTIFTDTNIDITLTCHQQNADFAMSQGRLERKWEGIGMLQKSEVFEQFLMLGGWLWDDVVLMCIWLVDGVWRAQQYSQYLNLQLQMADKDSAVITSKVFSLVRLRAECKMAPVRVDFSTPHLPATLPTSILPIFNNDRLHRTPAFLLPSNQKYFRENLPFEEQQFEERIKESLKGISGRSQGETAEEMWMALPGSNFCQICQEKFQIYPTHIITRKHLTRQTNAKATSFILDLCAAFTPRQNIQPPRGKTKLIRKQRPSHMSAGEIEKQSRGSEDGKGQNFSTDLVESWEQMEQEPQCIKF